MDYRDPEALRELAEQKEKEWKDIADKRFFSFIVIHKLYFCILWTSAKEVGHLQRRRS